MANLAINKVSLNEGVTILTTAPGVATFELDFYGQDAPKTSQRSILLIENTDTVNACSLTIKKSDNDFTAKEDLVISVGIGEKKAIVLESAKFQKNDGKIYCELSATDATLINIDHLVVAN